MDVKTLSAMLGHVSAATTLDIYTHITDDMQRASTTNIDRGIGKSAPQETLRSRGRKLPRPRRKIPEADIIMETRKGAALSYAPEQVAV